MNLVCEIILRPTLHSVRACCPPIIRFMPFDIEGALVGRLCLLVADAVYRIFFGEIDRSKSCSGGSRSRREDSEELRRRHFVGWWKEKLATKKKLHYRSCMTYCIRVFYRKTQLYQSIDIMERPPTQDETQARVFFFNVYSNLEL